MNERLYTLKISHLNELNTEETKQAISSLESGKVIYLPNYPFTRQKDDAQLLSDKLLDGSHKNISFDYSRKKLGAFNALPDVANSKEALQQFMQRFAEFAKELVNQVCPHYKNALVWGRTSYRPAEIKNRHLSKRKDDTRLHVDSFPGTPVYGHRILRVFSNINPVGESRVWNLGEPFNNVLSRFSNQIPAFSPLRSKFLYLIKATKKPRSAYDHYMINMHDLMKKDDEYQQTVPKNRVEFPPDSSWIVFTDHVSHAALSGQYVLEQTFYLPVEAMVDPEQSPLRHWEKIKASKLK